MRGSFRSSFTVIKCVCQPILVLSQTEMTDFSALSYTCNLKEKGTPCLTVQSTTDGHYMEYPPSPPPPPFPGTMKPQDKLSVFLRVLWFSPLLKNQHFQIPIRSATHECASSSQELVRASRVNSKLQQNQQAGC